MSYLVYPNGIFSLVYILYKYVNASFNSDGTKYTDGIRFSSLPEASTNERTQVDDNCKHPASGAPIDSDSYTPS